LGATLSRIASQAPIRDRPRPRRNGLVLANSPATAVRRFLEAYWHPLLARRNYIEVEAIATIMIIRRRML
jgi:hypothetical protein